MCSVAMIDHLTSDRSSMAFDTVELRDHLSVVDRIKSKLVGYLGCHMLISLLKVHPPADQGMQRCHAAIVVGEA